VRAIHLSQSRGDLGRKEAAVDIINGVIPGERSEARDQSRRCRGGGVGPG